MAIPPTKLTEVFIRGLTYKDTSFLVRDTTIKVLMVAVNKHSKPYKAYSLMIPVSVPLYRLPTRSIALL
jgi:hypothetical protein